MTTEYQMTSLPTEHRMLPLWQRRNAETCESAMLKLLDQSTCFRELAYSAIRPGRKLRGSLALQYAVWLGLEQEGSGRDRLIEGVARAELLHSASCILDDIIDGDQERRGRLAFHVRAGLPQAILTAQELIAVACDFRGSACQEIRRFQDSLISSVRSTLIGEAYDSFPLDLTLSGDLTLSALKEVYLLKTTPGFALCHEMIGLAYNLSDAVVASMKRFGAALGAYYQYANDYYDWFRIDPSVRGGPGDYVLISLCIPTIVALNSVSEARALIGRRLRREEMMDFRAKLVDAGVEEQVREGLDRTRDLLWEAFPMYRRPVELEQVVALVDSCDFWGYNYSL